MTPKQKVALFSALIMAPLVIALVIYLVHLVVAGERHASFLEITDIRHEHTISEVENTLGRPARIEHSESTGVTGDVYHYPDQGADMKIIFVNGVVFHAESVPGAKS